MMAYGGLCQVTCLVIFQKRCQKYCRKWVYWVYYSVLQVLNTCSFLTCKFSLVHVTFSHVTRFNLWSPHFFSLLHLSSNIYIQSVSRARLIFHVFYSIAEPVYNICHIPVSPTLTVFCARSKTPTHVTLRHYVGVPFTNTLIPGSAK